jgi:hypothetical protein
MTGRTTTTAEPRNTLNTRKENFQEGRYRPDSAKIF